MSVKNQYVVEAKQKNNLPNKKNKNKRLSIFTIHICYSVRV